VSVPDAHSLPTGTEDCMSTVPAIVKAFNEDKEEWHVVCSVINEYNVINYN
jgi:hypothetical protein